MMNDWTDMIGEELKGFEVPLPADDWDMLQRKRAAALRRRKVLLWSWAGVAASVAAVLAVVVMMFRGDSDAAPFISPENIPPVLAEIPSASPDSSAVDESVAVEPAPVVEHEKASMRSIADVYIADADISSGVKDTEESRNDRQDAEADVTTDVPSVPEELVFDVVRDSTASQTERLMADNIKDEDWGLDFVDFPEEKKSRRKVRMALGVSGTGASFGLPLIPYVMDAQPDIIPPEPVDSTLTDVPQEPMMSQFSAPVPGERWVVHEDYDHFQPVSFGLSVRFMITDRLSVNTGLNYTLYTSRVVRIWSDGEEESLKQSAHYIGIPVRCDWMMIDRKKFGLYLGVGAQVDKAVYAKVGTERLYDPSVVLFSINGVLGLQYNITDRIGLYLEPELVGNLNSSSNIETFRNRRDIMLSARAGLRVNL